VGRPDEKADMARDSHSTSGAIPASPGNDSDGEMRAIEKQIARLEQSAISEIRALQAKIDQLAAATNAERIAALEEKFTAALDKFSALARQWETQALRVQTRANTGGTGDQAKDPFTREAHPSPSADSVSAVLTMERPQPSIEPVAPIMTAAEIEPNTLLKSYHADAAGSHEQKRQLQQRISADIERVRAELRKRAGVAR